MSIKHAINQGSNLLNEAIPFSQPSVISMHRKDNAVHVNPLLRFPKTISYNQFSGELLIIQSMQRFSQRGNQIITQRYCSTKMAIMKWFILRNDVFNFKVMD